MHVQSWMWIKRGTLAAMLSAVAAAQAGAAVPDAWITTKIKLALLTRRNLSAAAVKVDTVLGTVTLYGNVPSAGEKAKVETVARRVQGVQNVRNLLQVAAAEREKAKQASENAIKQMIKHDIRADGSDNTFFREDEAIKEHVRHVLRTDPALKNTDIIVPFVNQRVVPLSGEAKTLSACLRAVEVAATTPGVHQVTTNLRSAATLADAEIWRASAPHGSGEGDGIWGAASDIWITSDVRMRMLADSRVAGDINLDSLDGVVTLFGVASSEEAKAAAEADARGVSGVKSVTNELRVAPLAKEAAAAAPDEKLKNEIRKALDQRELRDTSVEVKSGVARLTGAVPSGARSLEAALVARSIPGVRAVEDNLSLSAAGH